MQRWARELGAVEPALECFPCWPLPRGLRFGLGARWPADRFALVEILQAVLQEGVAVSHASAHMRKAATTKPPIQIGPDSKKLNAKSRRIGLLALELKLP